MPATRELAGLLGLNRTTISAAYEMLESEGLIAGQVGRGSFVTEAARAGRAASIGAALLERSDAGASGAGRRLRHRRRSASSMSRPSARCFRWTIFARVARPFWRARDLADILQLGSPSGYEPLRRCLLEDARRQRLAGPGDDLIVTNGCQQALDLIGRVLLRPGDRVVVEDPVYTGLKNLLAGMGAQLVGIPVGAGRARHRRNWSARCERERPRFMVVTPNFQNPTGATLPLAARRALLDAARAARRSGGGERRLRRTALSRRAVARHEAVGRARRHGAAAQFLQGEFSGAARGLGAGAEAADRPLAPGQGSSDLHTDQLSQAVLLEFAESGRLEAHRARVLRAGAERLAATLEACRAVSAGGRALDAAGGRNERVGAVAGAARCGRAAGARPQGGRGLCAGPVFRGVAPGAGRAAVEFRGPEPEQIRSGLAVLGRVSSAGWKRPAQASIRRRRWCEENRDANDGRPLELV